MGVSTSNASVLFRLVQNSFANFKLCPTNCGDCQLLFGLLTCRSIGPDVTLLKNPTRVNMGIQIEKWGLASGVEPASIIMIEFVTSDESSVSEALQSLGKHSTYYASTKPQTVVKEELVLFLIPVDLLY